MNTDPNENNNNNFDENENNINTTSNNENEPIYVMTLELEEGKTEQIKIYSDSDPEEISYSFCKKHNMDYKANNYLTEQIKELMNQYRENSKILEEEEHNQTDGSKNIINNEENVKNSDENGEEMNEEKEFDEDNNNFHIDHYNDDNKNNNEINISFENKRKFDKKISSNSFKSKKEDKPEKKLNISTYIDKKELNQNLININKNINIKDFTNDFDINKNSILDLNHFIPIDKEKLINLIE